MEPFIDWTSDSASVIPFASFAWAVRQHFICPGPMPWAMRMLLAFSGAAYASFLLLPPLRGRAPCVATVVAGRVLFCVATILFWWAVRTTSTIRLRIAYLKGDTSDIVSNGPYALVRHPFYLAYMLFWIGTALVAGGWQWLPALALIAWYCMIARSEEQLLVQSPQRTLYRAYRRRTGMFLPSMRRRPP